MRRFEFEIENGSGDTAHVTMNVREDRSPNQYCGPAIIKAQRVLPDAKPWRVVSMNEVQP